MICTAFDRRGENNLAQAQCKYQKQSGVLAIVWSGRVFLNGAFLRCAVSLQMQRPGLLMHSYAGLRCCCCQYCCPTFCLSRIDDHWSKIDNWSTSDVCFFEDQRCVFFFDSACGKPWGVWFLSKTLKVQKRIICGWKPLEGRGWGTEKSPNLDSKTSCPWTRPNRQKFGFFAPGGHLFLTPLP